MTEVLDFINFEMDMAEIPYEFGEWQSEVRYPYFVGSYTETGYSYEDNCTEGIFVLDGWSRNSLEELMQVDEKIKEIFRDLQAVKYGRFFYMRYCTSTPVQTGVEGLFRINITLNISEWKGE